MKSGRGSVKGVCTVVQPKYVLVSGFVPFCLVPLQSGSATLIGRSSPREPPMPCLCTVRYLLSKPFLAGILFLSLLSLKARAQLLVTTDSALNTGTAVSATYHAPGTSGPNPEVHPVANASKNLWMMVTNPWGVNKGSGTVAMNYSGTGTITTNISLTGLPGGGVDGSPFTLYGCDQWFGVDNCTNAGGYPVDQPLQFPKQISAMSSLMVDYTYALSGTITGARDIDMIWDEWVCRTGTNVPNGPG